MPGKLPKSHLSAAAAIAWPGRRASSPWPRWPLRDRGRVAHRRRRRQPLRRAAATGKVLYYLCSSSIRVLGAIALLCSRLRCDTGGGVRRPLSERESFTLAALRRGVWNRVARATRWPDVAPGELQRCRTCRRVHHVHPDPVWNESSATVRAKLPEPRRIRPCAGDRWESGEEGMRRLRRMSWGPRSQRRSAKVHPSRGGCLVWAGGRPTVGLYG